MGGEINRRNLLIHKNLINSHELQKRDVWRAELASETQIRKDKASPNGLCSFIFSITACAYTHSFLAHWSVQITGFAWKGKIQVTKPHDIIYWNFAER